MPDDNVIEILSQAEAGYGRTAEIVLCKKLSCDVCRKEGPGMASDSSDGEYGGCGICLSCIEKAVAKLKEAM